MFLTKTISEYLNTEVSFKKFKLAKYLSADIEELKLLNDAEQRLIKCYIDDQETIVAYDPTNTLSYLSCTCENSDPDDCVHIVASLYMLLSTSDSKIANSKVKFEVVKKEPELNLERAPINQYRKLPHIYDDVKNIVWDSLYTRNRSQSFIKHEIKSIELTKSSELEIKLAGAKWEFYDQSDTTIPIIHIKQEEDTYYIKCNTCEEISALLCKHQHAVLKDNSVHRILSKNKKLDYSVVSQHFMEKLNMSKKLFDIAYTIELKGATYHALEIEDAMLPSQAILSIQKKVSNKSISQDRLHNLLEQKSIVDSENWANAYLWSYDSEAQTLLGLYILKGKSVKTKNKLGSRITIEEKPTYFSTKQLEWYDKLTKEYSQYAQVSKKNLQGFLNLLQDNIEQLQHDIQYITDQFIDEYEVPKKSDLRQVFFQPERIQMSMDIKEDDGYYLLSTSLYIDDIEIKPNSDWTMWPLFCIDTKHRAFMYESSQIFALLSFWTVKPIIIKEQDRIHLLNLFSNISGSIDVKFPESFQKQSQELVGGKRHIYMSEAGEYMVFTPKLSYDGEVYDTLSSESYIIQTVDKKEQLVSINQQEKEDFINYMIALSDRFAESYQETGQFYLSASTFIKDAWFLNFYESCRENEVEIFGQETLNNFKFNSNKAQVSTTIASGIDWFEVDVDLSFGEETVSYKTWIEAIKNNEKYVKLGDGTMGILPDEWFEKIKNLYKLSDDDKDGLKINHFKYSLVEELFEEVSEDESYLELRTKFDKIKEANFNQNFELPKSVTADLRPYQMEGYQWLCTLDQIGFGGCLADDMGLGKTVQMISLLAYQKELAKGVTLVIVPRSLLFNWIAEIEKFCPDLQYFLHHGPKRSREIRDINQFDIILTTYDTATSDIKYLKEIYFNYIILDESQAIKNPNSKRYKAMRVLRSSNRFVMTGTPIENNTFDLYAQFSFINPGIFGGQSHFKDRFSTPIDKEGDVKTSEQLKKIIHPFLLRRTKELVAKDLPAKSENIIYCEMGPEQRKMYEDLKNQIAIDIKESIKDNGLGKSKFKILDGLLRLRQLCNSPLLFHKTLSPSKAKSIKIDTLVNTLQNDLGHHNALVFSQFTSMLALIRKELDDRNIAYAYLDGQTRDRKSAVEEFQDNDDVKVFLLSLKAGNTGLNLVKADYVYIVDPWWNPAVEAQAIDRTHRIGQDKNIFAYKMICKDTIEEKILELQVKKKKIAKDIIVSDENIFKSLGKSDLLGLFE